MSATLIDPANTPVSPPHQAPVRDYSPPPQQHPDTPRAIRARTLDDRATLLGAAVASLAFVWICYENLLNLNGTVGFVVCWLFSYLAFLAGLTSLSHGLTVVADRVISALVHALAATVFGALVTTVVYCFVRGFPAYRHINFFVHDMGAVDPLAPFTHGGIEHAIVGSLVEIGIAISVTIPLGIGTAIYMTEVGGRFAKITRTVVEAMTALPSIVAALFVYSLVVVQLHVEKSGIVSAMAISIMILPIIARTSDVVLRIVPGGLREASLALGASQWQTIWRVVLPTVRPGLGTAVILGVARGIGETSPVLLTSIATDHFSADPVGQPMNSLPLFTYFAVRSGQPIYIERGFGAASVLLAIVLVLFVATRIVSRQKRTR